MIPAHANGSRTRAARDGDVAPSREPLEAVLELGRTASRGIAVGLLLALVFHGTAAARAIAMPLDFMRWSRSVGQHVHERLWGLYDIEMTKVTPPPEAPPPPPPEAKEAPKEAPPPPHAEPKEAPPPAAAQAGAVLTKAADPNEPVDLTGNGFVSGVGSSYAGGITQANGTSDKAVYDRNARAGGVPGGTGTAPVATQAPAQDRSRPAGLSGSSEWKCPWPAEADAEQIDEAYVTVQVMTRPDGSAETASVLSDPGHGFAREARLCALRERYTPALDRDGNGIRGVTKAFRIHFER
jgi:protein TonB